MAGTAPRIFISHNHVDAHLAGWFSRLLTTVSGGVLRSFRSSDKTGKSGIPSSRPHFEYILGELERTSAVVCLLTINSFNRPWVLYEAGVAMGKGIPVHGLAIGIDRDRLNGTPFTNFENRSLDAEQLTGLLIQLLQLIEGAEPDRDTILGQVKAFIAELNTGPSLSEPKRTMEELLEGVEKILNAKTMRTTYVGQYPQFFKDEVCEKLKTARQSIHIACDYPAYGFVTDHDLYTYYNNILKMKAQELLISPVPGVEPNKLISATVLSESVRDDIIKNPFPDDKTKWKDLMDDPRYQQGIAALQARFGTFAGPEDFYQALRNINREELTELKRLGFTCYPVKRRMPIFAWIVDGQRAAFAIPTYLPGDASIEHAFSTSDAELIKALEGILSSYREDAEPLLELDHDPQTRPNRSRAAVEPSGPAQPVRSTPPSRRGGSGPPRSGARP